MLNEKFYCYKSLKANELYRLENYLNQKIWFTRLDAFNDPFEGNYRLSVDSNFILNTPAAFDQFFTTMKNNVYPDLTRSQCRSLLKTGGLQEEFKKANQLSIDSTFAGHGAICLTKSKDDIPMWAYYADNYKGYCLIFELDFEKIYEIGLKKNNYNLRKFESHMKKVLTGKEILSFNNDADTSKEFIFSKVLYKKTIPTIVLASTEILSKSKDAYSYIKYVTQNSVCTKSTVWEHEKEYRLITNTNSQCSGLMDLCN